MGFVVQSSFGKYLLVKTKDKAGEDFHEDGTDHTHEQDQDYHDTGFPHTHGPDSLEDNAAQTMAAEAGQDYHDAEYDHTHGPGSEEEESTMSNDHYPLAEWMTDLLKKVGTKKKETGKKDGIYSEPGNDYHDTGYPHTHSPESEEKYRAMETDGDDYHDTGYYHTHGPDSKESNNKERRKSNRKQKRNKAKKRAPKRERVRRTWGNAA